MVSDDDSAIAEGRMTALLDELAGRLEALPSNRLEAFHEALQAGDSSMATPSEVLRETIRQRGLTAYRLSKQTGVSVDAIQRFINGERGLRLDTFDALCAALGLELSEPRPRQRRGAKESDTRGASDGDARDS